MVNNETFQKVKEDLVKNKGFSISRVAQNTREDFIEYAKSEWADDRGAALTHIWKFFKGECSSGHEEIDAKLDILADEVSKLQQNEKKEEPKAKRLDGSIPGEEQNGKI